MRYGSVCSGIEAATVAWHSIEGWAPAFFSEIEPFSKAVLAHRWPGVPDLGDFTKIGVDRGPVDLLVGGTPCQSFSVAGLRGGMADARGSLALEFLRLAARLHARWVLWENVPGVLSSNGGRDFGALLGGLAELGYGFAYRVLDAQFFGVAQRRRRVFVVGHAGGLWQRAAAVLFERASLRGDPAPRREKGAGTAGGARGRAAVSSGNGWWDEGDAAGTLRRECDRASVASTLVLPEVAGSLGAGPAGRGWSDDLERSGAFIPLKKQTAFGGGCCSGAIDVATACNAHGGRQDFDSETFIATLAFSAKDHGADAGETAPTLRAGGHTTSHANGGVMPAVQIGTAVRRLTPRECERLQGFPDDYTAIPGAKDGPRYRALGNSMAVPVMRWIGHRIAAVDDAVAAQEPA